VQQLQGSRRRESSPCRGNRYPVNERPEPSPRNCLAYAVLEDHESWLGAPSPSCLSTLLAGAAARAALVGRAMPAWRIYGPLETSAFYVNVHDHGSGMFTIMAQGPRDTLVV
jgi:hypothetical protein